MKLLQPMTTSCRYCRHGQGDDPEIDAADPLPTEEELAAEQRREAAAHERRQQEPEVGATDSW